MKLETAPADFREITITLETQDDADMLAAVLSAVAENRINHAQSTIAAAKFLHTALQKEMNKQ